MTEIRYADFDLLIERTGEKTYRVRVLFSPAGQAVRDMILPFSPLELENFLLKVGRTRRGVRRLESPEMEAAKTFGSKLFKSVFNEEIMSALRSSLEETQKLNQGLRVRLRLNDAPELLNLPWEYLYNPALNRFLSLSINTPLVRYLELPERIKPLSIEPPLKMLVMISSPSDYPGLDVEHEWKNLKTALADLEQRGVLQVERLRAATPTELQSRLRRNTYHIFHFIGHGGYNEQAQDGLLLFEDESGRGRPLSGQYLGTLLHDENSLRLAVLNACEGGRTGMSDPFSGVAQSLVQQGLPAVIAMQFEVTDRAAITFAQEFYTAIADNYPVDASLAEARKAIFSLGNDIEWGTPVLYMRAPDGVIFDVSKEPSARQEPKLVQSVDETALAAVETPVAASPEVNVGASKVVEMQSEPDGGQTRQAAELTRQNRLAVLYRQAWEAMQERRWQEASELLFQVKGIEPGYRETDQMLELAKERLRGMSQAVIPSTGQTASFGIGGAAVAASGAVEPGSQSPPAGTGRDRRLLFALGGGGIVVIIVAILLLSGLLRPPAPVAQAATSTPTPTSTTEFNATVTPEVELPVTGLGEAQTQTPTFTPTQIPTITPTATPSLALAGIYRIQVFATGRFLHLDGTGDQLLSTRYQSDDDYTRFYFEAQADGSYRIGVLAEKNYLHDDGQNDQLLSTRYQSEDEFSRFVIEPQADGTVRIRVKANDRYLYTDGRDQLVSTREQVMDDYSRFWLVPAVASPPPQEPIEITLGSFPDSPEGSLSDTYLSQANSSSVFGADAVLLIDGDDPKNSGQDKLALIRWDTSLIPPGSQVLEARFKIYVLNDTPNTYPVYAMLQEWQEDEASWNMRTSQEAWGSPGAAPDVDYDATPISELPGASLGENVFELNTDGIEWVQNWVDNPESNYGIYIGGTNQTDGVDIASKEDTVPDIRPALIVLYMLAQ